MVFIWKTDICIPKKKVIIGEAHKYLNRVASGVYKNSKDQILNDCIIEGKKKLNMLGESLRILIYNTVLQWRLAITQKSIS